MQTDHKSASTIIEITKPKDASIQDIGFSPLHLEKRHLGIEKLDQIKIEYLSKSKLSMDRVGFLALAQLLEDHLKTRLGSLKSP
jgi:hypothetical protein